MKLLKQSIKLLASASIAYSLYASAVPGFTTLPTTTPFPHPTIAGASTAYVRCNNTGGFGYVNSVKNPTTSPHNECFLSPNPAADLASPIAGYVLVTSATRPVILNNIYSGNTNKNIGTLLDVVWRKPAATAPVTPIPMCIYGTKFTASTTDYNTIASGNQFFETNGIARGGFVDTATNTPRDVEVAYARLTATSEVLYTAGRAFTSVQHRIGNQDIPQTGLGSNPSINGTQTFPGSASIAQQKADLDNNWVEFTTDINALDGDGETTASSAMFYVRTSCSTAAPIAVAGAIRLRQTFQNQSTDGFNPPVDLNFIEVPLLGFVPPNGAVNPLPVSPF